ncbi:recombinase family protein [Dysosmobacter sp. NSJ-60]|nr:recombinase family protein [Dysosmobacter hominis]
MKREQIEEYLRASRLICSAIYLRKSRAEEHMSLEETLSRHRAALIAYAEKYGYRVDPADIYEEVVSGESLFARPQMLRLMEAVTAGRYEAVLCMDMQRLGRGGMYDQGFILDTFKESETLIVTPERVYDLTKEMDEQAAEMETFLSRGEYRMITKRLRRGTLQSVQNGAYMANPPFGYRKVRVGRLSTLEIVPEEADCVRRIFELYAAGDGCTKIERAVNAMGYHGRRGSRFNRNTIRLILDNPVYIGKIRWNKTSTIKTGIGADRIKKVIYNKPDHIQIIEGRHPPIISQDLWDAVQARRKSRYFYVDNKHIASPLAGLVRCSKCGRLMNMMGKNKGVAYLLCPTKGCTAGAKFHFVEKAVLAKLEELAHDLEVEVSQSPAPDVSAQEKVLAQMRAHAVKLEDRRNRLYTLLEDGTYSREVFSERMQVLSDEETRLKTSMASVSEDIRLALSRNKEKQLEQLRTVLTHYQDASLSGRKELLQSIISGIEYTKEKKSKPADFSLSVTLRDFI